MKTIASYKNGNVNVVIKEDGTKHRFWKGDQIIIHPESVDVKITDYCDAGCAFCHEKSTVNGLHGNISYILKNLKYLPKGVEVAIGGGNPLSHPNIRELLLELKKLGLISNITVNQFHVKKYLKEINDLISEGLIYGLGISYIPNLEKNSLKLLFDSCDNIVFHFINKVHTYEDIYELYNFLKDSPNILILGYKDFGRGSTYKNKKEGLENSLENIFKICKNVLFDNLAIDQVNLKPKISEDVWNYRYMGGEFETSMFFDGVKEEFAPTSTSEKRYKYPSLKRFWFDRDKIKND